MRYWLLYCAVIFEVVCAESASCKSCNLQSLPRVLQCFHDCNLQYLTCGLYNIMERRSNDTPETVSLTFENLGYVIEIIQLSLKYDFPEYVSQYEVCVREAYNIPELKEKLGTYMKRKDESLMMLDMF